MPRPEAFNVGERYFAILFHELTHSKGHRERLDRNLDTVLAPFGSPDYSREELVTEMDAP
jgi:antirestriction protein ArdC